MSDTVFRTAWRRDDPKLMKDAKAFWGHIDLIPEPLREGRARQLGVLAYSGERVIASITGELTTLPGLRARFAVSQVAVDPEFRRKSLALRTTGHFLSVLEAWSLEHPEHKLAGMVAVIDPKEWGDKKREPVWPDWGLNIAVVGYTPRDEQIRVAWFRHARV